MPRFTATRILHAFDTILPNLRQAGFNVFFNCLEFQFFETKVLLNKAT